MRQGIWIPARIESRKDLSIAEKVILSEIESFTASGKCFASNEHFANLLGLKPDTISRMISRLKKRNFIVQVGFDGRRRFLSLGSALDVSPKQAEIQRQESQICDHLPSQPALDDSRSPLQNKSKKITIEQYKVMLSKFPESTRRSVERVLFGGEKPCSDHLARIVSSINAAVVGDG